MRSMNVIIILITCVIINSMNHTVTIILAILITILLFS